MSFLVPFDFTCPGSYSTFDLIQCYVIFDWIEQMKVFGHSLLLLVLEVTLHLI